MAKKKHGAKITRGHAELRPNPQGGGVMRVEDIVRFDIPQESAILMTIDSLQDAELKQMMKQSYWEVHTQRKELSNVIVKKNEERADKALEADIKLRDKTQLRGFVSFLLVFAGFMVAVCLQAPAYVLWSFSVFFVGPAGIYLLSKFGDKNTPAR